MTNEDTTADRWIGPPASTINVAASMSVGVIPAVVSMTQPLLLGALSREGRLTTVQIGQAATLELAFMGIVATILAARLKPTHIRPMVAAAALVAALVNIATPHLPAVAILAMRALSGTCSGVFMWQMMHLFARSRQPTRLTGIYLAVQGSTGFLLSALFANFLFPRAGALGGYAVLAALCLAHIGVSCFLAPRYAPLSHEDESALPEAHGLLALGMMFIFNAAILAGWVYLPALATQLHYPAWVTGIGSPLALAMEIAGGLCAAVLASQLSYRLAVPGGTLLFVAAVLALSVAVPPVLAVLLFGLFGFLWMFVGPFLFDYTIAVNPDRRAMVYVMPAQLLGCGAGPMLASTMVSEQDVRGALMVSAVLFVLSLLIYRLSHMGTRPAAPAVL